MTEKKEGGKNRYTLARDRDSSRPAVGCGNQYSTSVTALQEEVCEKFGPKKVRSLRLVDLYQEIGLDGRSNRVFSCGTFLEFRVTEQEKRLHGANFCRDRFCPMCNWRRSLKIFGQVSQIMNVLEARGYRFLFLTLTVRNCKGQDFPATVKMIFDGWRKFYHDYFRKGKALKGVVCGAFRSLETTINHKTGEFHPHLHVILAVTPDYFHKSYIKQEQWAEMWREACGLDYKPIVDIRTVAPKRDKRTNEMSLAGAVAEVAKYAVKDDDYLTTAESEELDGQLSLSGADRTYYLRVLMQGLTGRRLVDMVGCFREVKRALGLDDAEDGDLIHVDPDEEIREDVAYLIVRYRWRNGVYVESVQRPGESVPDEAWDEPPIRREAPNPEEGKPSAMGRCSICGSVFPRSEFPFWSRQKRYCRECVQNWDKL